MPGAGSASTSLECDVTSKVCPVVQAISDHLDNTTELTKNGLNTVKVPDEVLGSETAGDAVELANEIENKSEIGLQLK